MCSPPPAVSLHFGPGGRALRPPMTCRARTGRRENMAGTHRGPGVQGGGPSSCARPAVPIEHLEPRTLLTTYWVDAAAGSDAFPGTTDNPFRTITRAVNLARAGDIV